MIDANDNILQKNKQFPSKSKIYDVSFYILGDNENEKDSSVIVTNKELFKGDYPVLGGIYDAHMGTTEHSWLCDTCGNDKTTCPGHAGSIELNYPVKSPLFRDHILKWLKIICFSCGKLVYDKPVKAIKNKLLTEYVKLSREMDCTKCGAKHPKVIKDKTEPARFYAEYTRDKFIERKEIFNHEIKEIFERISDETVLQVGKPLCSHPKKFILSVIRVAPNTTRPDKRRSGSNRSTNTDITALIKTIIDNNRKLPNHIPNREQMDKDLIERYFILDMTYFELVKGSSSSNNQVRMVTNTNKAPSSIAGRIPKKEGRIRKNLMGKRVRYMMRSVITGDNMLKVDEVGVPISIAKSIHISETVRPYNRDKLNTYYKNGDKIYPGCSGIIKKDTGRFHKINYIKDYQLKDGDVVMRDMITGDIMGFNRQPSLTFSSISAVKVIILPEGESLRMNVSSCNMYNADFDGDEMNGIVSQNIQARNELKNLSSLGNWVVSYKDGAPMVGAYQDSLIGTAEFTRSVNYLDKYHAMSIISQSHFADKKIKFDKKIYQSREIVSMFLPKINYPSKRPKLYIESYDQKFIKYDSKDKEVVIKRGMLEKGILDKSSVGQGTGGSIIHIINNEYGYETALNTVYSLQQITSAFFLNAGFTTGLRDINISEESVKKIKDKTAKMILNSRKITDKLNRGKLIAPIGMTISEFYELEQLNALNQGDDFVEPILGDMDFYSNGMAKLVFSGSKGKTNNMIAINGAIGTQTINGKRMTRNFGWGRTSPYFLRHDMDAISLGYVPYSFREGTTSDIFSFQASEARHSLISNALSTSITGHQNRLSIKNLESILVDNLYKSMKGQNLIQPLYAESGIDPRRVEKVKFKTITISDKEMEEYKTKLKDVNKIYQNKNVEKLLNEEYDQLLKDREMYRSIFMKIESNNPGNSLFDSTNKLPVNVYRIIEDAIYNYKDEMEEISKSEKMLDPVLTINKVKELCDTLPYCYYNSIQEYNKIKIPEFIKMATTLLCILIRSYLCVSNLLKKNVNNILLDIIINKIKFTFKRSLINYGTSVGIIAAQCVSEPMTQYMLDSKHRAGGGGGSKTNTIDRIKEIFGAKNTETMKNPSMLIMVKEEYEETKMKVQEIANYIEMMNFNRFIKNTRIFFEKYGNPIHSKFKDEKNMIKEFEKYNLGMTIPNDITKWCIRFELNREEMIINSMKLETIINVLRIKFPYIFFVYTSDNAKQIIIRCYIRSSVTSNEINENVIKDVMKNIKQTVIRGVSGIKSSTVVVVQKSIITDDGSIKQKKVYGINTNGSNLEEILDNPYVDQSRTQTDSVIEIEEIYGVEAARHKIINEIRNAMSDVSKEHCSLYADEMTYSGKVTPIHKTGLQKREMSNVTLRLSFQSPVQVIENAAVDGLVDNIGGISGPLILGRAPNIGTTFNKIVVNEHFKPNSNKISSKNIDDL